VDSSVKGTFERGLLESKKMLIEFDDILVQLNLTLNIIRLLAETWSVRQSDGCTLAL
jgi:hypothetical protein